MGEVLLESLNPKFETISNVRILGTLTKPWFHGFVILSAAKNLRLYGSIETVRFARGDIGEV